MSQRTVAKRRGLRHVQVMCARRCNNADILVCLLAHQHAWLGVHAPIDRAEAVALLLLTLVLAYGQPHPEDLCGVRR